MTTLIGDEFLTAEVTEAPPATPPLVSLLTSARVDERTEAHWAAGVAYLPECTARPAVPYWWACPEEGHDT